jgi:hypothetical protein
MKESKFYNDEFEELIRQKTDQYKMYPSDKVWKEIYNSLHTRRRRFIVGMSVLISGILVIAGKELLTPAKNIGVAKKAVVTEVSKPDPADIAAAFQAFKKVDLTQAMPVALDNKQSIRQIIPFDILADQPENKVPSPSSDYNNILLEETQNDIPKYNSGNNSIEKAASEINTDLAESFPRSASVDVSTIGKKDVSTYNESDKKQMDWLQEYAIQHLSPIKKNKFTWQIYVSPTVNYRSLSGVDYSRVRSTVQNVPIALVHFGNVNDFVDHTPAVGYEFGGSMLYKLTRNLSFKAGLQFNYSRYIIRAFNSNPELATIALNSYYGYLADSITGYTNVRNFSGKSSENLQNKYYQLSAPIGLEMRIIGNGKLQFNIAGTIQPTYLLNRNSYLLTTDYVNYTKEPSLFRKWNVNGGLEAFLSYEIGGLRWQLGPQFRYQLLSTYTDKYPIKENLIEYGFKIGISKIIR